MDDLIEDSSALKVHLVPHMQSLSDLAAELVNFGISVRVFRAFSYLSY